jgi:hypothetical protein
MTACSSAGSWLYRIATNACLDTIARRPKRVVPIDYGPPAQPGQDGGDPLGETLWVEPHPDGQRRWDQAYQLILGWAAAEKAQRPRPARDRSTNESPDPGLSSLNRPQSYGSLGQRRARDLTVVRPDQIRTVAHHPRRHLESGQRAGEERALGRVAADPAQGVGHMDVLHSLGHHPQAPAG